jgi:HK97 gp10 family phage protein
MGAKLILSGVDELLAEISRLSPDLTTEAIGLQQSIANETAAAIRAAYPSATGALRASVQVERLSSSSPARVFTQVTVTSPYAEYVEFGTATTTPTPAFVPLTRIGRERFTQTVIDRVKAKGLVVGGDLR